MSTVDLQQERCYKTGSVERIDLTQSSTQTARFNRKEYNRVQGVLFTEGEHWEGGEGEGNEGLCVFQEKVN